MFAKADVSEAKSASSCLRPSRVFYGGVLDMAQAKKSKRRGD
jgi:hypothetical protein